MTRPQSYLYPLLCLILIFLSIGSISAQDAYSEGVKLMRKRQFAEAETRFTQAVAEQPQYWNAYLKRAMCRMELQNLKGAEADLKESRAALDSSPDWHFAYGYLLNTRGKYYEAVTAFSQSIILDPNRAIVYNNRGLAFQNLGKYKAAIQDYSLAIQTDSTFALAYSNRAAATYYNQDIAQASKADLRLALRDLDKALHFDKNLCVAHRNRGAILKELNQYEESRTAFTQALSCNERDALSYWYRGQVLQLLQDYAGAQADFETARQYDSILLPARADYYLALAQQGNYAQATQGLQKLGAQYPVIRAYTQYHQAVVYALQQDTAAVFDYLAKADKSGYFRSRRNWEDCLKDKTLSPYLKKQPGPSFVQKTLRRNKHHHRSRQE